MEPENITVGPKTFVTGCASGNDNDKILHLTLKYRKDPARALIGQKPMFYQSSENSPKKARALIG